MHSFKNIHIIMKQPTSLKKMWVALLALLATAMPAMAQEGDYDPFQA